METDSRILGDPRRAKCFIQIEGHSSLQRGVAEKPICVMP
jgi:hypothetical protein